MVFYDNGLDSDIEMKAWNKPKKKLEMERENMLLYITKRKSMWKKDQISSERAVKAKQLKSVNF